MQRILVFVQRIPKTVQRIRETMQRIREIKPLIGKNVEIIVQEEQPGTGDWEAAARAAQELRESGYDFDAWREQRDYDLKHANDHLP